jgi:hypothetical protein
MNGYVWWMHINWFPAAQQEHAQLSVNERRDGSCPQVASSDSSSGLLVAWSSETAVMLPT